MNTRARPHERDAASVCAFCQGANHGDQRHDHVHGLTG